MNGPDLETRMRSYYRTFEPKDSTRLMLASETLLEEARRPRPKLALWGGLRLAATLGTAAVLLAVLVLPRLGSIVGPGSAGTFDPAAASKASVQQAGLMRSGGIWAVAVSYLLTSTDNGASWHAADFPAGLNASASVFVLDQNHAWVVNSCLPDLGTTSTLVVDRTADGGRTWQLSGVSGAFSCSLATISFVDANHGFVMCALGASPDSVGPSGPAPAVKGSGTVLRTVDGGASWQIMSQVTGLGGEFTASDVNTLWSAEDTGSSVLDGVALHVSRDAGATWSTVDLPELATLPKGPITDATGAEAAVAGRPTFVDASHGAFAVLVSPLHDPRTVWFYATADAGRSWTLLKKTARISAAQDPVAVIGREWAIVGTSTLTGLTVSGDSGASWTDVPGSGLPDDANVHPSFGWVDFTDQNHAAATINYQADAPAALMLSSDAGRTWHAADFGEARAGVPANPAMDPAAAQFMATWFEGLARRDPTAPYAAAATRMAWGQLSAYSQQAFGSMSAFEAAEAPAEGNAWEVGDAQRGADVLSPQNLGAGLWSDLNANADMSRAYVVHVSFPGISVSPATLVVAPLAATGERRIWLVTMPGTQDRAPGTPWPAPTAG